MTPIPALKQAAERAEVAAQTFREAKGEAVLDAIRSMDEYRFLCTPTTILSLLAERERLREALEGLMTAFDVAHVSDEHLARRVALKADNGWTELLAARKALS